ncbi:MAG: CoA transferase [Acidimicrobiales bacterium]|nr:CoA transferase [Acidimicrobiales bacterium]
MTMLGDYRVIELADERGQLAGSVLASLGAEVITVEPPDGSHSRSVGPFADDVVSPDTSLWHWSYNRGKKSIVVDLETADGRDELLRLTDGADIVIEAFGPGVLNDLGLGYDVMAERNPALIHLSISAFGDDGPKALWEATDLTIMASGGQMSLAGDLDRSPLRIPLAQAHMHASSEAAGAALIALYERQHNSGLGQHINLSAQASTLQASQTNMVASAINAPPAIRSAGGVTISDIYVQLMWPCADGHVSVTVLFGPALGPFTRNLMEWVFEEGFCDEATRDKDWLNYGELIFSGQEPVSEYNRVKEVVGEFCATKTKAELFEEAFTRRLLIAPITTAEDVLNNPHLTERGIWEDIQIGDRVVRFPGRMAIFSETPQEPLPQPPTIGEHTEQILSEAPRTPKVVIPAVPGRQGKALEGLKILDFMWVMAGPAGSRVLADYGANIIRIDSEARMDTARTLQPFRDDEALPDNSALYSNMNAGKRGLSLDLTKPESIDVVHDLVQWADVVLESFSPKGMAGFGLDYKSLRKIKPDIVMASSCIMGQTGPYTELAGYGTMAAAISGFFEPTGWPDRAPSGPFGAYTDYISPRFLVSCIMAAVEHHRATGQGQYIDFSQGEASMQQLTPLLLDWTVNGRLWDRMGNRDVVHAPHAVFPSTGDDEWVAIAVTDDDQWRALCELINAPELAGLDIDARRANQDELEQRIGEWTSERSCTDTMATCQAAGIPSHRVQNTDHCLDDPQLAHRNHFIEVGHPTQGTTTIENSRFIMSRTPAVVTYGGPTWGEHNWEILTEELGYDPDRIAELAIAEVLG